MSGPPYFSFNSWVLLLSRSVMELRKKKSLVTIIFPLFDKLSCYERNERKNSFLFLSLALPSCQANLVLVEEYLHNTFLSYLLIPPHSVHCCSTYLVLTFPFFFKRISHFSPSSLFFFPLFPLWSFSSSNYDLFLYDTGPFSSFFLLPHFPPPW